MQDIQRMVDLHIHTVKSDGSYTVPAVFEKAKELGLSAIAITDHDSVSAAEEAIELEKTTGVEFIPGVELSAMHEGREVHIVGLCLNWRDKEFNEKMAFFQKKRSERAHKIIKKLKEKNINIDYEELFEITENMNNAGRLHIARLLVKKNVVRGIKDAFDRYLAEGRPAYVEKAELSVANAVQMIKRVGGVAILAHPALLNRDDLIPGWAAQGMDGLEAFHSDHSVSDSQRYMDIAAANNMLVSGGSDFHGSAKEYVSLGKVKVEYKYLQAIKERAAGNR